MVRKRMTYDEFCEQIESIAPGAAIEEVAGSGELVIYTGYAISPATVRPMTTQEIVESA